MTRGAPRPVTTCDHCGDLFPHADRLMLLAWVDDELVETAWLCYPCGLERGGVPVSAIPMIESLMELTR